MRLNVQTMKNVKYAVDVNETDTVLDVKRALQQQHQLGDPDEQKLIHVGKILKDEQTLDAAKVKNNDLIVVMISKKKTAAPKPAEAAAATAPAAATEPAAVAPPAASAASTATSATTAAAPPAASTTASPAPAASTTPAATPAPAAAASAGTASSAASATSALLTGAAYEEAVTNLMSFGFPHDQVVRALRAAFNNADRAAEYLFSGIPASALAAADAAERRQTQPAAAATASAGDAAGAAGTAASSAASTSVSSPATTSTASPASTTAPAAAGGLPAGVDFSALGDLGQLRTLLTSNPGMLPVLISQLAQSNPQLVQQLEDNPQAFLSLMQALGVDPSQLGGAGQLPSDLGGAAGGGGRTVIQITEEEKAQIDNLQALGFPRDIALEAWLLCDRNQELAAAYLLEHGGEIAMDDDGGGMGGYGGDLGGGGGGGGDDEDDDIDPADYME